MSGTVVISGASGFLGRHLLARFVAAGRDVVALTRDPSRLDDLSHPRLRVAATDYGPSAATHLERSCSVIHLAARRNAPMRRPSFDDANVRITETLAHCALQRGADRFVNVSTILVFGPSATPREETSLLDGHGGGYARSRVEALLAVERVAAGGLSLATLLVGLVFGPDHRRARNRITSHIRRVLALPFRVAVAGGQARRNLVYVDDVADSIVCAERMEHPGGRHLVSGENVTQDELEREARAAARLPPAPRLTVPRGAALAAARTLDAVLRFDPGSGWTSRTRTLFEPWCVRPGLTLGAAPTPFREGVRKTVEELRKRG